MINVVSKKCEHDDCLTVPSYNYEGSPPMYCKPHKKTGMTDVVAPRCQHCKTRATFNEPYTLPPMYCKHHATSVTMIDVVSKKCEHDGCLTAPSFNFQGGLPIYCDQHKSENMTNVVKALCQHEGCTTGATFNEPNMKPMYCQQHKTSTTMVDVKSRRLNQCEEDGCKAQPSFNYHSECRPARCAKHQKPGMINVVGPRCEHKDCKKQPCFNYPQSKSAIRCAQHMLPKMIDIVNAKKQCDHPSSFVIPASLTKVSA